MSHRLAWALGLLVWTLSAAAVVLSVLNGEDDGVTLGAVVLAVSFGSAGTVVAARRPDNTIGWILLVVGSFNAINAFTYEYPMYALVTNPGTLPLGGLMSWVGTWAWAVGATGFPLILWLFPTGRPVVFRWLGWLVGLGAALIIVSLGVGSWGLGQSAILAGTTPDRQIGDLAETIAGTGTAVLGASLLLALGSAVVRYRRAGGVERRQLKLAGYAGVVTALVLFTASPGAPVDLRGFLGDLFSYLSVLALPSIPLAIMVAILRYRLYDIDRLISRTVSYGVITAALLVTFLASVFILRTWLPAESELAVAGSTLAVAALFNPLRRRVQEVVDRRFNRARYDAQHTVDEFSRRLRFEMGVGELSSHLRLATASTVEPSHLSVWLRGEHK